MTLPSVLVLQVNTHIGLTIVRALGRKGVPVIGVSLAENGFGLRSRYLKEGRTVTYSCEAELIENLFNLVKEVRPGFLIGVSEWLLTALNAKRKEFEQYTRFLFAPQETLDRAFDKGQTLAIAEKIGIPVPMAYDLTSADDLETLAASCVFPVVLKPSRRYVGNDVHLNFEHHYIWSANELVDFLRPYSNAGYYPLIQRYYPGQGVGIEVCIYHGEPLAVFQHRRIREFPVNGGPSVYRRSEHPDPRLADWSLQLLRAMKWEGVAMVEFREDSLTGDVVLMEVNGRFWGSLALPVHAGVNFPYLLYKSMGLGTPYKIEAYREHLYCRQLSADTKWLWHMLRGASRHSPLPPPCGRLVAIVQYMRAFFECWHYDIEWIDDLRPALAFWGHRFKIIKDLGNR